MYIHFQKIVDDEIILSQSDCPLIVKSCFDSCTDCIRKRVNDFIDDFCRSRLTIAFNGFKIRLVKKV